MGVGEKMTYPAAAYIEKYWFRHNKIAGEPAHQWPPDGEDQALFVFNTNARGEQIIACYPAKAEGFLEGNFGARVEGNGCLTIYRQWDAGDHVGRRAVASYAPGSWSRWERT